MGTKKFKKGKSMNKGERKLVRELGLAGLGFLERVTALEIEGETALAKAEVEMASAIGSEGYVALRLGLAKEGRKTLHASLRGLNRLTETVMPAAERALMGALTAEQNRAKARLLEAEANLLNAQSRVQEAEIKKANAETERMKAEELRRSSRLGQA